MIGRSVSKMVNKSKHFHKHGKHKGTGQIALVLSREEREQRDRRANQVARSMVPSIRDLFRGNRK